MKNVLRLPILLMLLLLLAGCGAGEPENTAAPATTAPTETTEATEPIDYTQYYGPWNYNVVDKAKEDGKLHYYFMSNEGIVLDPTEEKSSKFKWGDCCLLAFPDGQTMLIDSGYYAFRQVIFGNLQQMGIKKLDYLVITHPHSDHQGGAIGTTDITSDFLDSFQVKQVYYLALNDPDSKADELVKKVCGEKNVPAEALEQGDSFAVGAVTATVLWPAKGTSEATTTGTTNVNNNSMVLRFSYGEHSSLFAADLHMLAETFCVNNNEAALLDVDLLKVPHHGHKSSSSDLLLDATTPEFAVATGNVNIAEEVLRRYTSREITLLYNWVNGYIHISAGEDGVQEAETSRNAVLQSLLDAITTGN